MRVRSHAPISLGREFSELRDELARFVEEFFGPVAPHPIFQDLQVAWFRGQIRYGHLMGTPRSLDWLAIYKLRAGPAFWTAQNNHRPRRTSRRVLGARGL